MVKEYGHLLRHDPAYAERAERVAAMTRDLAEIVPQLLAPAARPPLPGLGPPSADAPARVAFHPPCSLQHAQRIKGAVETLLHTLGAEVLPFAESHLCCGSAGTYSVLQPELAQTLRDRKLAHVQAVRPDAILSANVGCITHLQSGTGTPVMHWIEWLDRRLAAAPATPPP
jgi:glycolate oxidase iron-sulfur subunit